MNVGSLRRYRAIVEYDGTNFLGYQYQKIGRTVQSEIEKALTKITQTKVRINGAGRTDAGVHAIGQVVAFDVAWKHNLTDLHRACNALLPIDIVFSDLEIVDKTFHPRFDAISRSYRYTIINQPWPSVMQHRYSYHIGDKLDIMAMKAAGKHLIGSHDFASFGKPPQGKNTVRNIIHISWKIKRPQIDFYITANAFLYQMVRRIVRTLIKVGLKQWPSHAIKEILEARNLARSATPAPAQGLCLVKVTYPKSGKPEPKSYKEQHK